MATDDRGTQGADRADARAALYEQRKAEGTCTRCGARPASEDANLCPKCRRRIARIKRVSDKRRRTARAAKQQCVDCGRRSDTYRCTACSIRQGRLRGTSGADRGEVQGDGIRREVDGYDRRRFHGRSRRGAPTKTATDAFDLKIAMASLVRAQAGCTAIGARTDLPAGDRDAAEMAWLDQLAMASRSIEEVLERRQYQRRMRRRTTIRTTR